jgi:hypothetical protein
MLYTVSQKLKYCAISCDIIFVIELGYERGQIPYKLLRDGFYIRRLVFKSHPGSHKPEIFSFFPLPVTTFHLPQCNRTPFPAIFFLPSNLGLVETEGVAYIFTPSILYGFKIYITLNCSHTLRGTDADGMHRTNDPFSASRTALTGDYSWIKNFCYRQRQVKYKFRSECINASFEVSNDV